jgi:hypothetical protein
MALVGASSLITLLLLLLLFHHGSSHDKYCREMSCGPDEPIVQFPFQLVKESSQDRCVYPEFCLYCTPNKNTMMVLSTTSGPIKFLVYAIDYESNRMSISDPDNCIPKKFLKLMNSSFLPYRFYTDSITKLSIFNCSSVKYRHLRNDDQSSLMSQDMITCPIYISNSYHSVVALDLVSCTKMFDVSFISLQQYCPPYHFLSLSWPKQNCTECEAKGMKCKWKNNGTKGETQCFDCKNKRKTIQIPKSLIYISAG